MRAIVCGLIVGLFPVVCLADIIDFTFTGDILQDPEDFGFPPNTWNGNGPVPSTFQMTFDVNTLDPHNTLNYVFSNAGPPLFGSVSANLVATDFVLSIDGKVVPGTTSGGFGFSGTGFGGCCGYIGGGASAGNSAGSFVMVPDFELPVATQAELLASSDPLALLLNGSGFATDDGCCGVFFLSDGSRLEFGGGGRGVSAPEPGTLVLFALASMGLGFTHRRRILQARVR